MAKFYGASIDKIVSTEVVIEDKTTMKQLRLIQELEEKDKNIISSMLDTMLI